MSRDHGSIFDICEAVEELVEFVGEMSLDEFKRDKKSQAAALRQIAVIGEAARRLSPEFRAAHPGIPWNEIIAMRNRTIHEYDRIDNVVVWNVVKHAGPQLAAKLRPLLTDPE